MRQVLFVCPYCDRIYNKTDGQFYIYESKYPDTTERDYYISGVFHYWCGTYMDYTDIGELTIIIEGGEIVAVGLKLKHKDLEELLNKILAELI